jgi:hypothetical protein
MAGTRDRSSKLMKISTLKATIVCGAIAGLLILLRVQHERLNSARLEYADLLIASSRNNPMSDRAGRLPTSSTERDELGRLRREVNELTNLRAKRDEINRNEAEFQAMVVPPPPPPVPEGKVKPLLASIALTDSPALDRSTPTAALHQLILATQRGDEQLLDTLRAPGTPSELDDGSDLDPASPLHEVVRYNQAQFRLRDQDALEGATTVNLTNQRDLPDGRIALSFGFEWAEGRGNGRPRGAEALLRKVDGQWFFESLKLK